MAVFLEDLHLIGSERVAFGLGVDLEVVGLEVALVLDLALHDEADIDVGSGSKIVVNTSLNCSDDELLCLLLSHTLSVVSLEDSSGSERTGSHSEERSSLVMTISRNFDKLGSLDIHTTDNAVSADLATVFEDVVSEASNSHLDTVLTVSVEPVELQLAPNHLYKNESQGLTFLVNRDVSSKLTSDVITISSSTGTSAVNVGGQLVELLAVLVSDDRASSSSGISGKGNTSL